MTALATVAKKSLEVTLHIDGTDYVLEDILDYDEAPREAPTEDSVDLDGNANGEVGWRPVGEVTLDARINPGLAVWPKLSEKADKGESVLMKVATKMRTFFTWDAGMGKDAPKWSAAVAVNASSISFVWDHPEPPPYFARGAAIVDGSDLFCVIQSVSLAGSTLTVTPVSTDPVTAEVTGGRLAVRTSWRFHR